MRLSLSRADVVRLKGLTFRGCGCVVATQLTTSLAHNSIIYQTGPSLAVSVGYGGCCGGNAKVPS
jgi:hypothetical protein